MPTSGEMRMKSESIIGSSGAARSRHQAGFGAEGFPLRTCGGARPRPCPPSGRVFAQPETAGYAGLGLQTLRLIGPSAVFVGGDGSLTWFCIRLVLSRRDPDRAQQHMASTIGRALFRRAITRIPPTDIMGQKRRLHLRPANLWPGEMFMSFGAGRSGRNPLRPGRRNRRVWFSVAHMARWR